MTIGFLGAGNMASPIIKSIVSKGVFKYNETAVFDPDAAKTDAIKSETGVNVAENEHKVIEFSDILFLAVKPQVFESLFNEISDDVNIKKPVIISIAAGKTTDGVLSYLNYDAHILRIFPNLNATVGEAISAYTGNKFATEDEIKIAGEIAGSFGEAVRLPEELFPVFGVLGGCAPAYTFMLIDALKKSAEKLGLPEDTAYKAAVQVVLGSAKLLKEQGGDPEDWVKKVCSPGGTTIEGVNSLKDDEFEKIVETAFNKSYERDLCLSR